ncbi:MAG: chromosome partitioning protein ParB [Acidimicrobiia bacterium]|nr:MAG: chromosome partitioning protein ParB [Acidimicrobiia bacterium]
MSGRRGGLGRGLEALIPTGSGSALLQIPVDRIRPNPHQPRSRFDEESIAALAESIAEIGLLQPVVVKEAEDGGYVLVAGERRWRAARRAGLAEIPALVRSGDDRAALTEALVENLQREDLSPLEEAAAYRQLLDDFGMTHEEIGARVGKSRSSITNTLRLLQLPAVIQGMVDRGELSAGHAKALLGLDDHRYAEHVARRAVAEGWSVRQVEEAVRARKGKVAPPRAKVKEVRPVEIIELEQRLSDRLGTRVRIDYRNRKGKVEISFGSLDDLERIYRRFFAE